MFVEMLVCCKKTKKKAVMKAQLQSVVVVNSEAALAPPLSPLSLNAGHISMTGGRRADAVSLWCTSPTTTPTPPPRLSHSPSALLLMTAATIMILANMQMCIIEDSQVVVGG